MIVGSLAALLDSEVILYNPYTKDDITGTWVPGSLGAS